MTKSKNTNKQSYFSEGQWLKGNLHCHSTVSDGVLSPDALIKGYSEKGYDFLAVTDHNLFVDLGTEESAPILLIPGVEHDLAYSNVNCLHLVGVKECIDTTTYVCRKYTPEEMNAQQMVDMMRQDGQLVILAHPVWSRMEAEEILCLKDIHGIEVYNNGTERLCHAGHASIYWDMLLRNNQRVWGFASDDTHKKEDLYGGWICVRAKNRSVSNILNAIAEGQFYASNGPTILDFGKNGNQVYLNCSDCREIHFVSYPARGKSFFAPENQTICEAIYTRKGNEAYIRAECMDVSGRIAWTNPIYFDE